MTEDIADLARRWSRAIQRGRGIRIEAADLDLLTDIGVNDIIQAAAAEKLKERAKWRADQRSADSMTAMPTGSIGTGGPMEARIRTVADRDPPEATFDRNRISDAWLEGLVRLSLDTHGPAASVGHPCSVARARMSARSAAMRSTSGDT